MVHWGQKRKKKGKKNTRKNVLVIYAVRNKLRISDEISYFDSLSL